ncbi:ribonuclease H [Senna tora]|uniref:Ribonuclease H n=1 Tax=Senna tora TaxID=362788 RepID=A0A834WMN8_9FABA|nr:ribonuclease H [Senna tora]
MGLYHDFSTHVRNNIKRLQSRIEKLHYFASLSSSFVLPFAIAEPEVIDFIYDLNGTVNHELLVLQEENREVDVDVDNTHYKLFLDNLRIDKKSYVFDIPRDSGFVKYKAEDYASPSTSNRASFDSNFDSKGTKGRCVACVDDNTSVRSNEGLEAEKQDTEPKMEKFYVVYVGRNPGIYHKWLECKAEIHKVSNVVYCSFNSLAIASASFAEFRVEEEWLKGLGVKECIVGVDGCSSIAFHTVISALPQRCKKSSPMLAHTCHVMSSRMNFPFFLDILEIEKVIRMAKPHGSIHLCLLPTDNEEFSLDFRIWTPISCSFTIFPIASSHLCLIRCEEVLAPAPSPSYPILAPTLSPSSPFASSPSLSRTCMGREHKGDVCPSSPSGSRSHRFFHPMSHGPKAVRR